ncbi:MAG: metallophosphoesterase [Deltaproteobacteria bacterium]|nr:metallophosphoesterase [Deltaproteobacteria bacterium]
MTRTMQYIAFYSVFFTLLWAMHLYVGLRLGRLYGCQNTWALISAFTLAALSFPAFSLLEKFNPTTFSMVLYGAASVWLGMVFLLLSILLVYEVLRLFMPLQSKTAAYGITGIAAALSIYGVVNALFLTVKTVDIPMPGLQKPIKIVQLSDIHVGTIHNSGFLTRIVDKTNALAPDLVLITGDLFDGIGPVTRHTVQPLAKIKTKTYFVIGNHERYDDMGKIQSILPDTGVEILRNRIVNFRDVQIVGVDAASRDGEKGNPVVGTLPIDRTRPSILMFHVPVGIEDAAKAGIKLQLSGHTHNGQLFPFTLFAKMLYGHVQGLYTINGMRLYVSPGTGTWGPPMRIGSSNEITLINLLPEH